MKLSVIMPVYNEEDRVGEAIKQLLAVDFTFPVELIIVDDCSTDSTPSILASVDDDRVRRFWHASNRGKGSAVRTGASKASGQYLTIFDADLEYDPRDIPRMVEPVLQGRASVVYGSRELGSHTAFSYWYVIGNRAITTATNLLYNCYLTDLETGLKLLPTDLYRDLSIKSDGFGMEAELTAKLLRRGVHPYHVPISYRARSRAEGKKITWLDGLKALWILLRERVRRAPRTPPARRTRRAE